METKVRNSKMKNGFISSIWDFSDLSVTDTGYLSHDVFRWYGKLIPQLVKRIILMYSEENDLVLANFCGSGTILAESLIEKRNAMGIDANPLAVLISKVKTSNNQLKNIPRLTNDIINSANKTPLNFHLNGKSDIARWFEPKKLKQLLVLREEINKIRPINEKQFFEVALAGIVRDISKVDHRCINHIVMDERKCTNEVMESFRENVIRIHKSVNEFQNHYTRQTNCEVRLGTALSMDSVKSESVDLVFSHPPYLGAIDYYNIFKLSTKILGFNDKSIDDVDISGSSLKMFMYNMKKVFSESLRVLKPGKFNVVVIGDVRKDGGVIPLGYRFVDEAIKAGFKLMDIFIWVQKKKAGMSVARRGNHIDHNYILVFKK